MWLAAALIAATVPAQTNWQTGAGHRMKPLPPQSGRGEGFTLLSPESAGVSFTNQLSFEQASQNHNLLNGAGVAAGDFNQDGLVDLYFCNLGGPNALFQNIGNWRFQEVTQSSSTGAAGQASTGAVFADVNGDGLLDLLVTSCGGPNALFLNKGSGRFEDVTQPAGLVSRLGSTSMALADTTGDGFLDLYVANYGENTIRSGIRISARRVGGRDVVTGRYANRLKIVNNRLIEYGEPDAFYANDGKGAFQPVSWTDGAFVDSRGRSLSQVPRDLGLTVQFRDLNGDRWPDLYVCNDFHTPDRIWIHQGNGTFHAVRPEAFPVSSHFSMAVDFADINRDGLLDLFVADMARRDHVKRMVMQVPESMELPPGEVHDRPLIRRNTLFVNRGDGTWAEIANYAGVAASDWTWSTLFLDVDLDGYEDLLIANGHAYDTDDQDVAALVKRLGPQRLQDSRTNLLLYPKFEPPNTIFRNRGDLTFEDAGARWGFDSTRISHGMALADLDNDGDLDVVVNCYNASPLIYRNDTAAPRVAVRLKGLAPNTQGTGARITLHGGAVPVQFQDVLCGGRYLSGDDPLRVFAAGSLTNRMRIEVAWRSGRQSVIENVRADHIYEIDESAASSPNPPPESPPIQAAFEDISDRIHHLHHPIGLNDFATQTLLPKKLSHGGPGAAWFDMDGDGREELILGAGRGGTVGIFKVAAEGEFVAVGDQMLDARFADGTAGVTGWIPSPGKRALLAAIPDYPGARNPAAGSIARFDFADGVLRSGEPLAFEGASPGPLAIGDINGDGSLDVLAGGHFVRDRFPEAAPTRIFLNTGGALIPDSTNNLALSQAGNVHSAALSDLTGDGWPDLILACEWGPIRVFHNRRGIFEEATEALGLDRLPGLWTSVSTGDFDGDGNLDIAAGNIGLNSYHHRPRAAAWSLFYGDFSGSGRITIVESYEAPSVEGALPWRHRDQLAAELPGLLKRFPTNEAYGRATIAGILGEHWPQARQVTARVFASMLFLNRGRHFEGVPLPPEAQWSPAMGMATGDLDGDGFEDLFIAQNFLGVRTEDHPLSSGRGLWLRGDGRGGMNAVPGQESGIILYGEQRGAALGDFDGDGRADLAVGQHSGPAKVFRNRNAKPGLRVRLQGTPGNPHGVGAVVRLKSGSRFGPAREVQWGAGAWSQNSVVQVLSAPSGFSEIEIRWPGGNVTVSPIPAGAREIVVDTAGKVIPIRDSGRDA